MELGDPAKMVPCHRACALDEAERLAALAAERKLGVHNGGDDMADGTREIYEFFEGTDGDWYWRKMGGNGEEISRSSEGYSSKEGAERGRDDDIRLSEAEADRQQGEAEAE